MEDVFPLTLSKSRPTCEITTYAGCQTYSHYYHQTMVRREGTLTTEWPWPLHHLQPRDTIVAMTIIIPIERAKYYSEDRR